MRPIPIIANKSPNHLPTGKAPSQPRSTHDVLCPCVVPVGQEGRTECSQRDRFFGHVCCWLPVQ